MKCITFSFQFSFVYVNREKTFLYNVMQFNRTTDNIPSWMNQLSWPIQQKLEPDQYIIWPILLVRHKWVLLCMLPDMQQYERLFFLDIVIQKHLLSVICDYWILSTFNVSVHWRHSDTCLLTTFEGSSINVWLYRLIHQTWIFANIFIGLAPKIDQLYSNPNWIFKPLHR